MVDSNRSLRSCRHSNRDGDGDGDMVRDIYDGNDDGDVKVMGLVMAMVLVMVMRANLFRRGRIL